MKSIVAVDEKWGIGKNNGLLFDIKADMRHFVEHTRGKIVVMGSNTLLSLPGGMPLKNRVNIVLNPDGSDEDAAEKGYTLVRSLDELLHTVAGYAPDNVYVIGGAMMYRTLLPYCSEAIVTKVRADGGAQVFYENLDLLPEWELAEESAPVSDSGYTMTFCTYRNRSPLPLDGGKGGTDNGGNADGNDKGDDGQNDAPPSHETDANGMKEVSPGHFVRTDAPKRSAAPKPDTDRLTYIIPASEFNDSPQTTGAPESVRNAVTAKTYLIIAVVVFVLSLAAMITIITVRYTPVELSLANYQRYMSYGFYLNHPATGTSFTVDLTVTNKSDRNLEISATWEMTTKYNNNGETRTTTVSRDFTLSPERSITMNNVASGTFSFSSMSVSLELIEIRGDAR